MRAYLASRWGCGASEGWKPRCWARRLAHGVFPVVNANLPALGGSVYRVTFRPEASAEGAGGIEAKWAILSRCPIGPLDPTWAAGASLKRSRPAPRNLSAKPLAPSLYCAKVAAMSFAKGHIGCTEAHKRALMSAHFAQQSSDEAACAVMSEHLAQGSATIASSTLACRY